MSCIHFKFKCDKKFDSVVFDGASCTLSELKKLIIQKKGLSKHAMDFDLLINNAQTKQVYSKPTDVIQRNSSVIVARIPAGGTQAPIDSAVEEEKPLTLSKLLEETAPEELARIERNNGRIPASRTVSSNDFWIKKACEQKKGSGCALEEDELSALSYLHLRESTALNNGRRNQFLNNAIPHPSYVCHRCHRTGHFKHVCPLLLEGDQSNQSVSNQPLVKRATGIPRSELIPLKSHFPGAYITSEGTYAIPRKDAEAIINADKRRPSWDSGDSDFGSSSTDERHAKREGTPPPPTELTCSLCKDLFIDAVMTPCCHENFCDSCIRNRLLESDEKECPACHQKDIPLDQIFANKFLRDTVAMYGRKKTSTVSELFDQREPDLDQAFTPTCLARTSAEAATQARGKQSVAQSENQQSAVNHTSKPNAMADMTDRNALYFGGESIGRFDGSYGPILNDPLGERLIPFAVAAGYQPYDQSATFAAMAAAAAAALFLPNPIDSFGSSLSTAPSGSIVDNPSSGRPNLLENGVQLFNSQAATAIAAAALARASTHGHGRNEYFDGTTSNNILSREQFEMLKETVSRLKASQAKKTGAPSTEGISPNASSRGRSRGQSASDTVERDDHEVQIPACCGDRSRKSEEYGRRGGSRRSWPDRGSADAEYSPERPFTHKRQLGKGEDGRRPRSKEGRGELPRECSASERRHRVQREDYALNVLEFSEDHTSRSPKRRKTADRSVEHRLSEARSHRRSRSAEAEQEFVLKRRLLSQVQRVKQSCPATNSGSQAEQWVEKEAKPKKKKSKHTAKPSKAQKHEASKVKSSKKTKKHKHRHCSSDGKKHHKSRKHKKSSKKRAHSTASVVT